MSEHLVVGASGLVGSHLFRELRVQGRSVRGTYLSRPAPGLERFDLGDLAAVDGLLEDANPSVVFFPAANPNVDWIEDNPEASREVNVAAPQRFLSRFAGSKTKVVYYSTEYVFDGVDGPYAEGDEPNPLSEYGREKLEMERFVQTRFGEFLILRVTVVYGWERQPKNFVQRVVEKFRRGETSLTVPNDQISSPTYAPNLAAASLDLADRASGIFHLCGDARCDRYRFACEIADVFELPAGGIVGKPTADLNQRASRPLRAGMIVEKAKAELDFPLLGFVPGLREMKRQEPDRPT